MTLEEKAAERDSTAETPGMAELRSYVDRTHHAVVSRGHFTELYEGGYLAHARSIGPLPDELALGLMRKGLAAAVLRLALLPPDQYCSWTYNIVEPVMNIFITGDNGEHNITGRIFSSDVKTLDVNRLFIEMARPHFEPSRSVVDFHDLDIIGALHEYYRRGLQMRARMFELADDDFVLIEGLPMVDQEWLEALDEAAVGALFDSGDIEEIERRTYRFFCGCDAQRMAAVMQTLFSRDIEELFQGEDEIEAQCPRCGQRWIVRHSDLSVAEA
jgi:molecular chaperone Hsp33